MDSADVTEEDAKWSAAATTTAKTQSHADAKAKITVEGVDRAFKR